MQAAINEARRGWAEGSVPIGSVTLPQGRIIGRGNNQPTPWGSAIVHGEMDAIESTDPQPASMYRESVLYTTRSPCCMSHLWNEDITEEAHYAHAHQPVDPQQRADRPATPV